MAGILLVIFVKICCVLFEIRKVMNLWVFFGCGVFMVIFVLEIFMWVLVVFWLGKKRVVWLIIV